MDGIGDIDVKFGVIGKYHRHVQAFTHRPADIRKGYGAKLLEGESASNLGHFQRTAENLRIWTRIREQAVNVGASRILLETSANFTPSEANKRALTAFAREWADLPDERQLRPEAVDVATAGNMEPASHNGRIGTG